jgi:2-oxoisovalerate dehydrogenase E1 component
VIELFNSLLCNGASHSAGRQMSAHLCARALNVLSLVGPVGNNALRPPASPIRSGTRRAAHRPVRMGDGTAQQGEVLEAIAEASLAPAGAVF